MKFLTKDQVELDYQDYGKGQPVVLVEGFGGYQEIWNLQVKYLMGMNCRVITYDHRNHGRSERISKGLQLNQLTDDLADLIDYLQLKKPLLIGHSMGASICYDYLSRFSNAKAVMAIDQSPKMLNDADWSYGFEDITLKNFAEKIANPNGIRETLHGLDRRIIFELNDARSKYPFDRDKNLQLLFDHVQKDWRRTVLDSKIPISLVAARQSPYFNSDFTKIFSDSNNKIKSVVLDDCGHDIMAEIPEIFDQSLRHFILSNKNK